MSTKRSGLKKKIGILVTVLGICLVLVAIAAFQLNIAREDDWGPARRFTLAAGIVLGVLPTFARLFSWVAIAIKRSVWMDSVLAKVSSAYDSTVNRIIGSRLSVFLQPSRDNSVLLLVISAGFSIAVITFLISVGRFTDWPTTTEYFHLLSEGFRSGHTYLSVEPDPGLIALNDPYAVEARGNYPYLWDASLYEGKYYLYWGPTPAIIVLIFESLLGIVIRDNHLVWGFTVVYILVGLIILKIMKDKYFSQLPSRTLFPLMLTWGCINPVLWIQSRPAMYEVAIISSQAFFLSAVMILLLIDFGRRQAPILLFLVGVLWALALGARFSMLPAIAGLGIFLFLYWLRDFRVDSFKVSGVVRRSLLILMPLLIGIAFLASYNYIRFGSIFEFGTRYQLGYTNFNNGSIETMSLENIIPNLWNYLFTTFLHINRFPFIKPIGGKYALPFLRVYASTSYRAEPVAGILITTPLLGFALVPLIKFCWSLWRDLETKPIKDLFKPKMIQERTTRYLFWFLFLAFILQAAPLVPLSWNSMRYILDFVPALVLASAIAYWWFYETLRGTLARILVDASVHLLSLYSITISFLLALTGEFGRLQAMNPELFGSLRTFFQFLN